MLPTGHVRTGLSLVKECPTWVWSHSPSEDKRRGVAKLSEGELQHIGIRIKKEPQTKEDWECLETVQRRVRACSALPKGRVKRRNSNTLSVILSWVSVEKIRVSECYFESQYLLRSSIWLLHICYCSFTKLCPSLCNHLDCSMPGSCPPLSLRVCSSSCPLMMPSNHLILCHPLLLLPSIFPSIRIFSNELALCIRWPKYTQDWFLLGLTGLISLHSKGLSRVFSTTTIQKHWFFGTLLLPFYKSWLRFITIV